MSRLINTISQMFVIIVLLFRSPPVVHLRDLSRRPAVVLIAPPHDHDGVWPPLLPQPDYAPSVPHELLQTLFFGSQYLRADQHSTAQRVYLPVKAA
ncbi:MAG: hypothetical protein HC822_21555 [Oscillochloris sp.]|nr:hypothetical protein [Oscillochloris sp.]